MCVPYTTPLDLAHAAGSFVTGNPAGARQAIGMLNPLRGSVIAGFGKPPTASAAHAPNH